MMHLGLGAALTSVPRSNRAAVLVAIVGPETMVLAPLWERDIIEGQYPAFDPLEYSSPNGPVVMVNEWALIDGDPTEQFDDPLPPQVSVQVIRELSDGSGQNLFVRSNIVLTALRPPVAAAPSVLDLTLGQTAVLDVTNHFDPASFATFTVTGPATLNGTVLTIDTSAPLISAQVVVTAENSAGSDDKVWSITVADNAIAFLPGPLPVERLYAGQTVGAIQGVEALRDPANYSPATVDLAEIRVNGLPASNGAVLQEGQIVTLRVFDSTTGQTLDHQISQGGVEFDFEVSQTSDTLVDITVNDVVPDGYPLGELEITGQYAGIYSGLTAGDVRGQPLVLGGTLSLYNNTVAAPFTPVQVSDGDTLSVDTGLWVTSTGSLTLTPKIFVGGVDVGQTYQFAQPVDEGRTIFAGVAADDGTNPVTDATTANQILPFSGPNLIAETNLTTWAFGADVSVADAPAVVAPIGGAAYRVLSLDSSNNGISQAFFAEFGKTYEIKLDIKADDASFVRIRTTRGSGNDNTDFDITSGLISGASGNENQFILPLGDGWFRCGVVTTGEGAPLTVRLFVTTGGTVEATNQAVFAANVRAAEITL